ncbi:unnamed protein product, partial [Brenthis ino]
MVFGYILLFLIFAFHPTFSYVLDGSKDADIITEYHVRGESMDLMSGVLKPFEAWYSQKNNSSRIDYYGGMVKNFYIGENDENVTKYYLVYPKTTKRYTNNMRCTGFKTDDKPLNIFPSLETYTYTDEVTYNNKIAQVWQSESLEDGEKEMNTMYLHEDKGSYIPVWLEMKTYNEWSGSLMKHRIVRYFDIKEPDEEDFNISKVKECEYEVIASIDIKDSGTAITNPSETDEAFFSFKIRHKRNYKGDEHEMRRKIFQDNLREVIEHNRKNLSYKKTINEFSDRTDEELAYLTATKPSIPTDIGSVPFPYSEEEVNRLAEELPENYDMRIDGYINVVKNQGRCGSCWSFSTTAAVEGALARSNGDRVLDLSEQSLVDCSWGYFNGGCFGGFIKNTFEYILEHGIPTERDYGSYLEVDGYCKLENMTDIYRIKGFGRVPPMSVNAMKLVLYKYGPVTVGINASPTKHYASGIFYDPECNQGRSNHAVTVVGYGVRDGATYFIVKNSWGENWGEDGYILFSTVNNNCHILEEGFYPIV